MSPNGTKTAWAAPGEGMLAFGIRPGEMPKDGSQLLGNNANVGGQTGFANGFEALKALAQKTLPPAQFAAAMKRGSLNAQDIQMMEQKGGLTMVVAGKGPGQDRSVRPLEDLGITQLSLGYSQNGNATDENGNDHRQSAGFVMNGQQKKVDDVWYQVA
jgi:hypothetical protein